MSERSAVGVPPASPAGEEHAVDVGALRARAVSVMGAHTLPAYADVLRDVSELKGGVTVLATAVENQAAHLPDIPLRKAVLRTVAEAREGEQRGPGPGLVSAHDLSRSLASTVVMLADALAMLEGGDGHADQDRV